MEVADERPIIDSDSATSTVGFSGWDKQATCRMSETQERKNASIHRTEDLSARYRQKKTSKQTAIEVELIGRQPT